MLKPWIDFSLGSCQYDCHACSAACPVGALLPLSLLEKQHTQIAQARYSQKKCNIWNIGYHCAQCVDMCPTGALTGQQVTVPFISSEKCSGCGRCARVCPQDAITLVKVEGRVKANGEPRLLATVDRSRCIGCGACSDTCRKRKAIDGRSLIAPQFDLKRCIGCGACAHICPAPEKAIHVSPLAIHQKTL